MGDQSWLQRQAAKRAAKKAARAPRPVLPAAEGPKPVERAEDTSVSQEGPSGGTPTPDERGCCGG